MIKSLCVNGVDIFERFKVVASEASTYKKPARSVASTPVNGRNGEILTDYKSMSNVEIVYNCVIHENFRRNYDDLTDYLHSLDGYLEIVDDADGEVYREGYYVGESEVSEVASDGGSFSLKFMCKPQRFLTSGQEEIIYSSAQSALYLNSSFPAEIIPNADIVASDTGKYQRIKLNLESYVNDGYDFLQIKVLRNVGAKVTVVIDNEASDYKALYCSANQAETSFDRLSLKTTRVSSDQNNSSYYAQYYPYWWIFIPILGGDTIKTNGKLVYRNTDYIHKELFNPTLQTAKPLITISSAYLSLPNGTVLMQINGIDIVRSYGGSGSPSIMGEPLVIDTETCAIYDIYNGVYYNAASAVEFMPVIPTLKAGMNRIDYHKTLSVSIVPRWWKI